MNSKKISESYLSLNMQRNIFPVGIIKACIA